MNDLDHYVNARYTPPSHHRPPGYPSPRQLKIAQRSTYEMALVRMRKKLSQGSADPLLQKAKTWAKTKTVPLRWLLVSTSKGVALVRSLFRRKSP